MPYALLRYLQGRASTDRAATHIPSAAAISCGSTSNYWTQNT